VTRNVDSIRYILRDLLEPFIGIYSINESVVSKIEHLVDIELKNLIADYSTSTSGPQVIAFTDLVIEQDALARDKLNITVNLTVPYALNSIAVTLIV
jgi:hypothetical protein